MSTDVLLDDLQWRSAELLDEVASGKVTGEEETWSHTDLWDFRANLDGARPAWEGLRPLLKKRDAALDTRIETRFANLQKLLDGHRQRDGFVLYTSLDPAEVEALSDAVNALSEPPFQARHDPREPDRRPAVRHR